MAGDFTEEVLMGLSAVLCDLDHVLHTVGASDVLIYRRAAGGRFALTDVAPQGVSADLLVDDEPYVVRALARGLCRVANEHSGPVCAGYRARAAAIVAVDRDVIVVLGRRDGCLAGVSDDTLIAAAQVAALSQGRGV